MDERSIKVLCVLRGYVCIRYGLISWKAITSLFLLLASSQPWVNVWSSLAVVIHICCPLRCLCFQKRLYWFRLIHNKQASWPPFPKNCTVTTLCICIVTALAERKGKEESIERGSGLEEKCFRIEIGHARIVFIQLKGCLGKWREERTSQPAGKNQKKKKVFIARVDFWEL